MYPKRKTLLWPCDLFDFECFECCGSDTVWLPRSGFRGTVTFVFSGMLPWVHCALRKPKLSTWKDHMENIQDTPADYPHWAQPSADHEPITYLSQYCMEQKNHPANAYHDNHHNNLWRIVRNNELFFKSLSLGWFVTQLYSQMLERLYEPVHSICMSQPSSPQVNVSAVTILRICFLEPVLIPIIWCQFPWKFSLRQGCMCV